VHDPALIILDEPTNGLDPAGREHILRLIGSLWRDFGISVIICSHLLHDVERICDRVLIIARGRIIEHDTLAALKSRRKRIVELTPAAETERFVQVLGQAGLPVEKLSNGRLRLESAEPSVDWLLTMMRDHQLPPAEIFSSPDALHGLFLQALAASGHVDQHA
jgi:ABC-2 type transport system ATP-binding protein